MPSLRRTCLAPVIAASLLMTAALAGGQAPQAGPVSERAAGPAIDFAAVEADGTPVRDLQRAEVEIRINDRLRVVRSLRLVAAAPSTLAGNRAIAAPYGTNDSVAAGRAFALIVDQESITTGHQQLLRNAVDGLVAELTPSDQVTVAALPFGGPPLPFTSDPTRVRLAMNALAGQGSRGETGSELACRTRRFLESLDAFLETQAGRPTPLTVIVLTAGLAAPRRDAPMALAPGICELPIGHFEQITASATLARANVYLLQPADVGMAGTGWRDTIAGTGYLGSDNPIEGVEHLAGVTGGARMPLDAAGTGALLRVARESSAYFVAELEPTPSDVVGRSRSLRVRVTRRGVTVRARPSVVLLGAPSARAAGRLTVSDLLGSTEAFAALRLRVAGYTVQDADGRLRTGVVIETADPAAALASAGAVLIGGDGRVAGRWFARDASERPLLGAIAAPPGTYRLRAAAIDAAGQPGAAEAIVESGLTLVGPLSLGSMMLGVSRDGSVKPQLEFGAEPSAIASFDIYGGGAGLGVTATLEIARGVDGPPLAVVPLALTRASDSRVVATGTAPIGALAPGDYVIRGVIALADGTSGQVIRTLRKVVR
jgi:hypothetical protein